MQIPIKRTVERIPGGFMLVPLLAGAVTHTFAPNAAQFFGSFTGAFFQGALPILAVFYVCLGSSISVRSLPHVVKRGGALLATKVALGIAAGVILGHFLGNDPVRAGWFAGVSTLAVMAAINDTNGGLYMALMNQYGTAEETAAYSVMGLESGPFLTMVTLGVAGLASFPWPTLLGAVLPLLFGMLVGNLDSELRVFLSSATAVMIPFFAFALGAMLNLKLVWGAGLLGIGLGLMVLAVSGTALLVVDKISGGTGIAGVGAATTAGNAAAVPALVAAANHKYAEAAGPATVLVASSVIVTTMLAPVLTAWWDVRVRRSGVARARRAQGLLVIADDLAGAADCAVACGRGGVVTLRDGELADAEVVAIDANTRCRSEAEAAAEMKRLVRAHAREERMLFRKVDSTLRGHVAAELAATLDARRETMRGRPVAVFAPAFPTQGRTVREGKLLVDGVPLAETDVWQRELRAAPTSVAEMFTGAALRVKGVGLDRIRAGGVALERTFLAMARGADVLICDAETEEDLGAIAAASMVLGRRAVWVGSAGLVGYLQKAGDGRRETGERRPETEDRRSESGKGVAEGPVLFVVGSVSPVSREQAERLAALAEVETVRVPVAALSLGAEAWTQEALVMSDAVQRGRDVLVLSEGADGLRYADGMAIATALGKFVEGSAEAVVGLVATGGETARAVLDAWGVTRLRVRGAVEAGVVFSITEGWRRSLPVVTKAGGFGDADTLVRCREHLRSGR